jgi:hypothetical protein
MIILLPLLIALIGLLMFALCANPKLAEIGKIMFFCGLLAFLLRSDGVLKLLG